MLAERVLRFIGERPVMVQGQPVRVTVSIGYARFPLPPNTLPVAWEQAINLADMALYTAKNQGRNRAVGIVAAHAPQPTGAAPHRRRLRPRLARRPGHAEGGARAAGIGPLTGPGPGG